MKDSDKPKLVIALILLAAAVAVIWYFDPLGFRAPAPAPAAAPAPDAPQTAGPRSAPVK